VGIGVVVRSVKRAGKGETLNTFPARFAVLLPVALLSDADGFAIALARL
jgi:hypothetical protein